MTELFALAALVWGLAGLLALLNFPTSGRVAVALGAAAFLLGALTAPAGGTAAVTLPLGLPGAHWGFALDPAALWLFGFGLVPVLPAALLGTTGPRAQQWTFGLAASLLGALGVCGLQDAMGFLVAWEVMSLGGAVMILGEALDAEAGRGSLFMLALLEVGAVALLLALLLLSGLAGTTAFGAFHALAWQGGALSWALILLLLIGFGAKIGLLPFYEWFPGAYGAASGATGAVMSCAVLNASYFALARGLLTWVPADPVATLSWPGLFILALATVTAVLTALYAFQQEDWRQLLCLSSAENGAVAVAMLGAALLFRQDRQPDLAGLAVAVGFLHLAAHSLAKGTMFLTADGAFRSEGSYLLAQSGLLRRLPALFGIGAVLATLSLAALPPTGGFVTEWYVFQVIFQGFRLSTLAARVVAALAGAGLALTAAIAFATFAKAAGIGLLGRGAERLQADRRSWRAVSVALLGAGCLVFAVGLPIWVSGVAPAVLELTGSDAVSRMAAGWLMVPLTATFAFTSPSKLIIAMPLLALLPLSLGLIGRPRRRAAVWFGGQQAATARAATTALTFSNALRTFYSFVYRPVEAIEREAASDEPGHRYFTRRLAFTHDVAPIFGPALFRPIARLVGWAAIRVRALQSGHLNFYLGVIGLLLVAILALQLFIR